MSKIQLMGSGAFDVFGPTKRVYFRPSSSTDTIRAGDLVCYNHDINADHKERTADPSHLGLTQDTYAEGAQDRTGRLFIVEKPASANLEFFAGVVKSLGPEAGGDGDMIEIWTPDSGAVVPVMLDIETTKNLTIVGVRNGAYEGSYPSGDGRAIGIAMESIDRSSVDGLCWVKLNASLFIRQGDYSNRLIIDNEASDDVTVNQMYVTSNQTAGALCLLRVDAQLDGAGSYSGGVIKVRAALNAAASSICQVMTLGFNFQASAELAISGGGRYSNAVIDVAIGTTGTPDLSGGNVAGIGFLYSANESGGAPQNAYVFHFNSGTYNWDGLIHAMNAGDIGDSSLSMSGSNIYGADGDGTAKQIPVLIGGVTYYLLAATAWQGHSD